MDASRHGLSLNVQPANAELHSTLSPETPSSMFGRTLLVKYDNSVIIAIGLSHWDNILGPKIRHLWHSQSLEKHTTFETLHNIANHTISGAICRDLEDSNIDCKFYVMKDKNLAVMSFLFNAMDKGDLVVHSLAVITLYKDMHIFLNWQQLTISWMSRGVSELRILLDKFQGKKAFKKFTRFIVEFVSLCHSICEAPVTRNIPISDTAFVQEKFDRPFLRKAILAHISTCGRSVVLGITPGSINVMIATLAMFLQENERLCCRYVTADRPHPYHPDLCVQGLLLSDDKEFGRSLENIYFSRYPTTLIDLMQGQVQVSSMVHQHRALRQRYIYQHLQSLWSASTPRYPTSVMFRVYDEQETIVTQFLLKLYMVPSVGVNRESFICKFMHSLEKKAVTLIKYVGKRTHRGSVFMSADQVRQMRHDLNLVLTGDFNAVLATAEKLKPDIYSVVYSSDS